MSRFIIRFIVATWLVAVPALAKDEPAVSLRPDGIQSLEEFARIPVLFNGRKMPMDSLARNVLLQLSGRRSVAGEGASVWLAQLMFEPELASEHKVFLVNHPEVATALGIEPDSHRRYSYHQLHPALVKLQELATQANQLDEKKRSPVEHELLRTFNNLSLYAELAQSMRFAAPHPDFTLSLPSMRARMHLDPDQDELSFYDLYTKGNHLQDLMQPLQNRDQSEWSPEEEEAFRVSAALYQWSRRAVSRAPTMIPADPHGEEVWLSPWEMLMVGGRDAGINSALQKLVEAMTAYRDGKQVEFDLAIRNYRTFIESRMKEDRTHMGLEVTFNRLNLFLTAKVFYGLAFMISFVAFVTGSRWLRRAAVALAVLGLLPHAAGVVIRMVIMGRPPVTNLYATFLFVGLVCVVLGMLLEAAQRNGLGVLAASFGGMALLLVAGKYFSDGDTMSKVVAVLDSNFWLATHVIAITIGYAGCVFAGLIGHIYLLCAIFTPRNKELLGSVYRALFGMLAFGLIFSFLGTMLGGVWADQSWGRFWGWDPKENGALLIVLWCAILFHAKIGGMISHRGVAAGSVLGVIVVLVAWLGVNLLSVGLHSYGFTSGLATGFFSAVFAEILFVGVTVPFARGTP